MKIKVPAHKANYINKKGNVAGYIDIPEVIAETIDDDAIDPVPIPTPPIGKPLEVINAINKWRSDLQESV
ncbi:MAG: hypothetical protein HKN40_07020, partial [Winogradskyella sp.]|uniref:hypothetical protein n=1 Tax=Winogradskyella sp. TaxID=1883156 RepID=UPI001816BFBF|nr:hypothetical protein [Winogradskyella sp.]